MPDDASFEATYNALRHLVTSDPKGARLRFCEILESNAEQLYAVLEFASSTGEGRTRLVIANAVRGRNDKAKVISHLVRWLSIESDEFAKRAISAALDGVDIPQNPTDQLSTLVDPKLVDLYAYVSGRLRHEIRNAIMGPASALEELEMMLRSAEGGVRKTLSELANSLLVLERLVEFNISDDYFLIRSVDILSWIEQMNDDYRSKYAPVALQIVNESHTKSLIVKANDYWLNIVFWNIWMNAQQAIGLACEIEIRARKVSNSVSLTIVDNGSGFPEVMHEIAFQEAFSTKGPTGGRGLLEIQDAIGRLHGTARLVPIENQWRMQLQIPLEVK
ncbi:MAG TPA: ATP-binding protein [Capsulimonadaceae bacterium]